MHKNIYKLSKLIDATAYNFNLGKIDQIEKIGGNTNDNYLIAANDKQFILKIHIKHSLKDLLTEVIYLNRLNDYDFPSAYYLVNSHNLAIFQYQGLNISVQLKLEGESPSLNDEVCTSIGHNIAKLHVIPTTSLPQRNHWLKNSFLPKTIVLLQQKLPDRAKKVMQVWESLKGFNYKELPHTIVHGDMFTNNCLYQNNNLIAFLDWEEVGIAPAVLDLATCIFNFCFEENVFNPKLYKKLVEGYTQVRPLSKLEYDSLKLAVQYAALTLSAWRIMQFGIYSPNPEKMKASEVYWNSNLDNLKL